MIRLNRISGSTMLLDLKKPEVINSFLTLVSSIKVNNTKLLSLQDKEEWSAYLNRLPESMQDVYYTPEYYEIYKKNGDGKAFCFVFEDGNHLALYPFLLNQVNDLGYELDESYYDIQGAYGYNGVVSSSNDPDFIKSFYNEFNKFCKGNNIIAEFTRFHPLLENYKFSKDFLDISCDRQTVYVDLTKSYDEIYQNYSVSLKKALRKAKKNNLTVLAYEKEFPYKREFVQMYKETMDRVNAEFYLYFNDIYFENLFKNLPLIQFVVFKDELPIVSLLCLNLKNFIHCHLVGYKEEYLSIGPNNLIYDEIIRYSIKKGFKKIHFGGGRSSSEDDSLLRFKKNFSKTTNSFYIGKKIYNQGIYEMVCKQWSAKYPNLVDKYGDKLLKYIFFN